MSISSPSLRRLTGRTWKSIARTRARSGSPAVSKRAGSVASTMRVMKAGAVLMAAQNSTSEPRTARIRGHAAGAALVPAGRSGAWLAGTTSTRARQRDGWRIANWIADRAPAEAPITIARSTPSASSRAAKASAWRDGVASAGISLRR